MNRAFSNIGRIVLVMMILAFSSVSMLAAEKALPVTHPKYKAAKSVYDKLINAVADGRPAPIFQVLPPESVRRPMVAAFVPGNGGKIRIILEEKAFDICVKMGDDWDDALAMLLGHELAHYYRNHGWAAHFGADFKDLDISAKIKKVSDQNELIGIETDADVVGGFYAHLAGYDTISVAPKMLRAIYTTYGLPEELGIYPNMKERISIAQRSAAILQKKFLPAFDAGVKMSLLHKVLNRNYEASRCFDFIASEFPSREILNNAGVTRVLEAIRLSKLENVPYTYPAELDAQTNLNPRATIAQQQVRTARGFGSETKEQVRARLLSEALKLFEKAKALDPNYATALVNLATVYDLMGKGTFAVAYAEEAQELAEKNKQLITAANARIIHGIALARKKKTDDAEAQFLGAAKHQPGLSQVNLHTLNPKKHALKTGERKKERTAFKREKIAGLSERDFGVVEDEPDFVVRLDQIDKNNPEVLIGIKRSKDFTAMLIDSGELAFIVSTGPGYAGKSARGIGLGSTLEQVREKYGHTPLIVASKQGTYHIYAKTKIAFGFDAKNNVVGWMIFKVSD